MVVRRERQDPVVLGIRLEEPFPEWAWPEVWLWTRDIRNRIMDDFGPQDVVAFVEWAIQLQERARVWGVWRRTAEGEELGGLVTFEPANPVMGVTHVVFRKSFWGRDTTVEALRQAYSLVFASGILKISSVVFQDNHTVRALARRGGAREEGIFLGHTLRGGKPTNMVALGIRKEDFQSGTNDSIGSPAGVLEQHEGRADINSDVDHGPDVHSGPDEPPGRPAADAAGPPNEGHRSKASPKPRRRPDKQNLRRRR